MKERVCHIFKKDAAHLWPQILIFLAMLVMFACEDPTYKRHSNNGLVSFINLLYLLLPLSCWLLVIALIHEETPIGHNQYWLTRPFTWTDLLAAKALFLLAFVNLPMFLCQAAVLAANGFSPADHLTDLLAKQVFFAALLVLPVAALAAVTKALGHTILCGLLLSVLLAIAAGLLAYLAPGSGWGGLAWIRASAVAAIVSGGAAVVLLLQYTRRCTVLSRAVLASAAVLVLLIWAAPPWQPAFALQSWLSTQRIDPQAVRILFDPRHDAPLPAPELHNVHSNTEHLDIPIQVANIPPGMEVVADWTRVQVEGGSLKPWRSGWVANWGIRHEAPGKRWLTMLIDADEFDRIKDTPIRLRGSVDLTLFSRISSPTSDLLSLADVWGYSSCSTDGAMTLAVQCLSTRPMASLTLVSGKGASVTPTTIDRTEVYAPYPTSPWFGTLRRYSVAVTYFGDDLMGDTVLAVEHPVAHIRRSFDFHSLRLADYLSTNN